MKALEFRLMDWMLGNDTGVSSKTIVTVMTGNASFHGDIPYDPDDFGRCFRLLEKIPEWRGRLEDVAKRFPIWGPMVKAWEELEGLYLRKEWKPMYERMKVLADEGRIAAGWTRIGPGSWKGPKLETLLQIRLNCDGRWQGTANGK